MTFGRHQRGRLGAAPYRCSPAGRRQLPPPGAALLPLTGARLAPVALDLGGPDQCSWSALNPHDTQWHPTGVCRS